MSNLLLICPKCGKATRIGFKVTEEIVGDKKVAKKERICKKCEKNID
jgi:large subunit ribosomal protein L24